MPAPLRWTGEAVEILDQTLLPHEERVIALRTPDEVADAIRRLAVRGAPLIGVAAAYGVVLARGDAAAIARLRAARPTAVNLAWAVDRVAAAADPLAEALASSRRTPRPRRRSAATAPTRSRRRCPPAAAHIRWIVLWARH